MLKVLFVASEAAPFAKSGGLGDVAGSLPKALRRLGIDVRLMLPKYAALPASCRCQLNHQVSFTVNVGWRRQYCGLETLDYGGLPVYLLDNEYYFKRPSLYGYYDEAERFAFFCRAVLTSVPYLGFAPDIIHLNDWHTGMIAPMLTQYRHDTMLKNTRTIFTVHNLTYQGIFPKEILADLLNLGWEHFTMDGVEYYDKVNFMKGGLCYADYLTTVSPTYAEEVQYPFFGEGLYGVIRRRRDKFVGIINGIDYDEYNPATDKSLAVNYTDATPELKRENKIRLQQMLGLPARGDVPLVAIVSRLVAAKGFDLIGAVLDELMAMDIQLVVLGTGDTQYEHLFSQAAWRYPGKAAAHIGFDDILARQIYAAADLLLMPSLVEPCGISQLIAMRYGCLPLVRETGGLKDTVQPYNEYTGEGWGFSFTNYNAHDMLYTIRRALNFYQNKQVWAKLVRAAMQRDYSWDASARRYAELYLQVCAGGQL